MRPTKRRTAVIQKLFDALTNNDCASQEDIRIAGGFGTVAEVAEALSWIRHPDLAKHYGWTVPHVPRGRPQPGVARRYIVVGLHGSILSKQDIRRIREGALSTTRLISNTARNEANALRTSAAMLGFDPKARKAARDTATILDGVAVQTRLDADRMQAILDKEALTFP